MKVGIDFGTTRIVVAAVDRGNYPLVNFETADGQVRDWFPALVALRGGQRLYGWEAWAAQGQPGWSIVRSLKRYLHHAGPETRIEIEGQILLLRQLLTEMMSALRLQLQEHSNLRDDGSKRLEAMLGVPANANSNQRFLTTESAREAGFEVLGLLNEPSAAAVEFAHVVSRKDKDKDKDKDTNNNEAGRLLVYDLGGGTFDASLIELGDRQHSIAASDGISTLGGDDFDEILAELALAAAGFPEDVRDSLTAAEWFALADECREKKEALNPNSRKINIDLERVRSDWPEVSVSASLFYERCRPLIESTRKVVEEMLAIQPERPVVALYVTGGGSELPPVARVLRESFGKRVRRSSYMRSATAIGLAIRADSHSPLILRERFMQHFGLWREANDGHGVVFDLVFPRGTELPSPKQPPLRQVRSYRPAHNVGHFRYLECAQLAPDGRPVGEIIDWDDIRFPFDPDLQECADLADVTVIRTASLANFTVEETYTCDSSGNVAVEISNQSSGYQKTFRLGSWSKMQPTVQLRKAAKRGK